MRLHVPTVALLGLLLLTSGQVRAQEEPNGVINYCGPIHLVSRSAVDAIAPRVLASTALTALLLGAWCVLRRRFDASRVWTKVLFGVAAATAVYGIQRMWIPRDYDVTPASEIAMARPYFRALDFRWGILILGSAVVVVLLALGVRIWSRRVERSRNLGSPSLTASGAAPAPRG